MVPPGVVSKYPTAEAMRSDGSRKSTFVDTDWSVPVTTGFHLLLSKRTWIEKESISLEANTALMGVTKTKGHSQMSSSAVVTYPLGNV